MEEEKRIRHAEAVKKWKAAHPEQTKQHVKRYQQTHREQWNAYQREYCRRKKAAERQQVEV